MYSPKIADEHIPEIYRIAKERGVHMTRLVNDLIAKALKEIKEKQHGGQEIQGITLP